MQKRWWYLLGIFALIFLAISLFFKPDFLRIREERWSGNQSVTRPGAESATCNTDNECVPASCCHARACVPAGDRPVCEGIRCTLFCEPGTLDCGQARCGCVNNQCVVVPS